MKTVQELEADLRVMREDAVDYSFDPDHDSVELVRRRSECANLSGAIECLKRGETPMLPSQQGLLGEGGIDATRLPRIVFLRVQ